MVDLSIKATMPATTNMIDATSFAQKNGIPTFVDLIVISITKLPTQSSKKMIDKAVFIKTP